MLFGGRIVAGAIFRNGQPTQPSFVARVSVGKTPQQGNGLRIPPQQHQTLGQGANGFGPIHTPLVDRLLVQPGSFGVSILAIEQFIGLLNEAIDLGTLGPVGEQGAGLGQLIIGDQTPGRRHGPAEADRSPQERNRHHC